MCSVVWTLVLSSGHTSFDFTPNPVHLLWALLFLKCYNKLPNNAAKAGCDEKTFSRWSWYFIKAIAALDVDIVS